jgi:hypothetical protein
VPGCAVAADYLLATDRHPSFTSLWSILLLLLTHVNYFLSYKNALQPFAKACLGRLRRISELLKRQ